MPMLQALGLDEIVVKTGILECAELPSAGQGKILLRKQILYVGEFKPSNGEAFSVNEEFVDKMVAQSNKMLKAGFLVPVNTVDKDGAHQTDPLSNKGRVTSFVKDIDSKGRQGVFATLEFDDANLADAVRKTDVSLYAKKSLERDGQTYTWPVMHVALTSYPQIPDLSGFDQVAASLPIKDIKMPTLKETIAKSLNLSFADNATDKQIAEAIALAQQTAVAEATKKTEKQEPKKPADKPVDNDMDLMSPTVKRNLLGHKKRDRESVIMALLSTDNGCMISAATAKNLIQQYCSEGSLSLALESEQADTEFNVAMQGYLDGQPILKLGEKSGAQNSVDLTPENNPLIACATKLREEHDQYMSQHFSG